MNPIVLVWTAVAACGLLLSLYLLVGAVLDLRTFHSLRNGRRIHARGRALSEAIRVLVHGAFLFLGVATLLSLSLGGLAVLVLVAGNALLIVNSLIAVYVRRASEVDIPPELTPEELLALAQETAKGLVIRAELTAQQVLDVAAAAAARLEQGAVADAMQRTAENTERIAKNTDPEA